jgi:hypothetical protein
VVGALERVADEHGLPEAVRANRGPEFILRAPLIGRLRVAEPQIWCSLLALVSVVLVSAAGAAGARSPLEDALADCGCGGGRPWPGTQERQVLTMRRRDVLRLLGMAACASAVCPVSAGEAGKPRWKTAIGLNDIHAALAALREGGFEGWLMIDAWETPDPYDASIKGKQAIDRARA